MYRVISSSLIFFLCFEISWASSIPNEFRGIWKPSTESCKVEYGFRVGENTVSLFNKKQSIKLNNVDLCYSCEGGARYEGIIVWFIAKPSDSESPSLTGRFNVNEREGVTILDFNAKNLTELYPLNSLELIKCGKRNK